MKKYRFVYLFLVLHHLFSFAQNPSLKHFPKLKGYERSMSSGILSKISMQGNFKKNNALMPGNSLQRNAGIDYEYFDIVKSSMNVPLSQCHDSDGNTFITGSSGNLENHSGDITTVKIDPDGTLLWTVKIPSPNFTVNAGTSLKLDNDGNIIVTGYIWNTNDVDIICTKISNNGQIVWQNKINNALNFEIPTAVFINDSNEILITGVASSNESVTFYTAKLSADGQVIWQKNESGFPVASWNEPKAISQDDEGNVIVVGYGFDDDEGSKIATIKYSSDGQLIWKRMKGYTTPLQDGSLVSTDSWANDFTIDSQNNIYVTGGYKTEFATSSTTFSYGAGGDQNWDFDYQHEDEYTYSFKILMHQNKLYVGGYHYGNAQDGYLLLSLNTDGSRNWIEATEDLISVFKFNMFENNDAIILNSISYTDQDIVNNKINTTAFSDTGSIINSSNYPFDNESLGLNFGDFFDSYMHNGNAVIAFSSYYSSIGNVYQAIKLETSNAISNTVWDTKFQENNATNTNVLETVSDADNNVYSVVSNFYVADNLLNQKSYLIKYNSSGEIQWNKLLDDSPFLVSLKLKTDSNGNVIVLLAKPSNDNTTQAILRKISAGGTDIWETSMPINISGNLFIEANSYNDLYIAATELGDNNTTHIFLSKISTAGSILYTNSYQPANSSYTQNFVNKLIVGPNDNVMIGGGSGSYNEASSQNVFSPSLLKVSSNGIADFYNVFPISGKSSFIADFDMDNNGFSLGISSSDLISMNNRIDVMALNQSGNLIWQNNFVDTNSDNYVYKLLRGNGPVFYTVGSRLGDSQNIQVIKWELNQTAANSVLVDDSNYYQDSYIDADNIIVLSQNQESLHFPRRTLNWIGPFISAKVIKFDYNLAPGEAVNLIGDNYSLYEPKQFVAMSNNTLLISGRMFDEQFFFEGLNFFSIPSTPVLNVPDYTDGEVFKVFFNYPNPISAAQTNVMFKLEDDGSVALNLYDLTGKFIKQLYQGTHSKGTNDVSLVLPDLAAGVYLMELKSASNHLFTKITVAN